MDTGEKDAGRENLVVVEEPCEHKKEKGEPRCEWCGAPCYVDEDGRPFWD